MGLPGHRRTSSHKRRRASHFALKQTLLAQCPQCAHDVLSHHACKFCGYYAGRQVIAVKTLFDAKAARKAKKAAHDHEHEAKKEKK